MFQLKIKDSVIFFYCDSFRYTYLIRACLTSSGRHAGVTLDWRSNSFSQAATSDECELTRFAFIAASVFGCTKVPAAVRRTKLELIYRARNDERLSWPEWVWVNNKVKILRADQVAPLVSEPEATDSEADALTARPLGHCNFRERLM